MCSVIDKAIVLRPNHILIRNFDMDQRIPAFKALLDVCTLTDIQKLRNGHVKITEVFPAYITYVTEGCERNLKIPREVPMNLIKKAFPSHTVIEEINGWPVRDIEINMRPGFDFKNIDQRNIFDFLTCTGSYEERYSYGTDLVVAGTATGKSYCAIRAWVEYKVPFIGIFAQTAHLENFKTELFKFTDLGEDEIIVIDEGAKSIDKSILSKDKSKVKCILMLHRSVANCLRDNVGPGNFSEEIFKTNVLFKLITQYKIGIAIVDEAHLELAALIFFALFSNMAKTIYLTATPKRTEHTEDKILGLQLPRDRAFFVEKEKRINVEFVEFNSKPSLETVNGMFNQLGHFLVPRYFDFVLTQYRDKWRELVASVIRQCYEKLESGCIGIVVSGKLDVVEVVIALVKKEFPEKTVGNFTSMVKVANRHLELDRDIIVTTDKSFNGSVNPEKMDTLILLAPLASEVLVEQITGRLRGLKGNNCYVIDVFDSGFRNLVAMKKKRETKYRKIALSVS